MPSDALSNPLAADLDHILSHTEGLWEELRGERIFITGGTGFFGCWLLESFAWANARLELDARAVVLSRNPQAFCRRRPDLGADPSISFHAGDVRFFAFPNGSFTHILHAATESGSGLNETDPLRMLETIVDGTRRTLDFAASCGAPKFLLTSSGAVYGRQPSSLTHVPETYSGAPDTMDVRSAYAEGKRMAELLCALYHRRYAIPAKIARCFAFVGPHLPLDAHFAVGNFLSDVLRGAPVRIEGDGTPFRSYLYAADLMIWLWRILFQGQACRPYNVGSDQALAIADLAREVSGLRTGTAVEIARAPVPDGVPERYVPATGRARGELGLDEWIPRDVAIRRTAAWATQRAKGASR